MKVAHKSTEVFSLVEIYSATFKVVLEHRRSAIPDHCRGQLLCQLLAENELCVQRLRCDSLSFMMAHKFIKMKPDEIDGNPINLLSLRRTLWPGLVLIKTNLN